uniref:synaptotagmin-2-like n=1 Tax=Myxine glutinosa TaxID=7769 RepID=UPI00358F7D97
MPSEASSTISPIDFYKELLPAWLWIIIACGVVFLLVLLLICCYCCCRRQRRQNMKAVKMKQPKAKRPVKKQKVQPDIDDLEGGHEKKKKKYVGKLHYSMSHSNNKLEVIVLKGEDLASNDFGGSSDPYVKVMLLPNTKQKFETKVYRKSRSPQFNETFYFEVSAEELPERTLLLSLYDFNRFSKHELVGEVRVPFAELDFTNMIEECRSLQPAANEEPEFLGEICFSLRYVPNTSKLYVLVLEAKELKACDEQELSDAFVKLRMYENGNKIESKIKRKMKINKDNTSIKNKTLSPYFNETFTFDLSPKKLKKVQLVLSVVHNGGLKPNTCIGRVMVGNDATGGGLQHWNDMSLNPRRPVAQWHPLQQPDEVKDCLKH